MCVFVFSVFSTQIRLKLNTAQNKRASSIMFNVSTPPIAFFTELFNKKWGLRVQGGVCVGGRHREMRTEIVGVFSGV